MSTGLDTTLAALADGTRRQVIDLLRERPRRVGELSDAVHLSAPATSKHLRVLRTCGLVEEVRTQRDARVHIYRLRPEPFAELRRWLDHVQAFWDEQLSAFAEYTERTRNGEHP